MQTQNQRKLIFENPKCQPCYLPCSFKERYEGLAVEQLLYCEEETNDDCSNFFRVSWSEKKDGDETTKGQTKEDEKDLGVLMYNALSENEDSNGLQKYSKGGISPWEVCESQQGHDGGYLREGYTWKQASARTRSSLRKFDKRRLQLNLDKQHISIQSGTRKCNQFEEKTFDKDASSEQYKEEASSRLSQTRSAPPHGDLKFCRFQNPRDFIVYYRDNITYFMIQQYLFRYLNNSWQATKSFKKPQQTTEKLSSNEDKKTQIFRLHLNDADDRSHGFGVLRVGPCPGTEAPSKRDNTIESTNGSLKKSKKEVKKVETPTKTTLQITITGVKPSLSDNGFEVSAVPKKPPKTTKKTMVIPKASSVELSRKEKEYCNDNNGGWKEGIKTVELQIVKAATAGSRAKKPVKKLNKPTNKVSENYFSKYKIHNSNLSATTNKQVSC